MPFVSEATCPENQTCRRLESASSKLQVAASETPRRLRSPSKHAVSTRQRAALAFLRSSTLPDASFKELCLRCKESQEAILAGSVAMAFPAQEVSDFERQLGPCSEGQLLKRWNEVFRKYVHGLS